LGIFFLKNGSDFLVKLAIFVVLLKFDPSIILQKFKKKSVVITSNQYIFPTNVYFRPYAGHESSWTSREKIDFQWPTVKATGGQIRISWFELIDLVYISGLSHN
jgi:hypothetical protein